jgi:dihydroxyacetone kinase
MCGGGSGHEPAHAGFVGETGLHFFLDQAYLLHFQAKACSRVWNRIYIPF